MEIERAPLALNTELEYKIFQQNKKIKTNFIIWNTSWYKNNLSWNIVKRQDKPLVIILVLISVSFKNVPIFSAKIFLSLQHVSFITSFSIIFSPDKPLKCL